MRPGLRRTVAGVAVVLTAAVVALGWLTRELLDRNRSRLLAEFSVEQSEHLRELAREVERDLDDLADRLLFATRLAATARSAESRTHATESLLRSSKAYRALLASGPWGELESARENVESDTLDKLRVAGRDVTGRSVAVSRLLESDADDDLLRIFAGAHESRVGRTAVAVVVDLTSVLHRLQALRTGPGDQLLVLGPHGLPTPISSPSVARTVRSLRGGAGESEAPNFVAALARMREGDTGTLIIGEAQAHELALDTGEVVMAYVPIAIEGGANWSVATLRSMAPLRAHETAVMVRFGSVAGLGVLILVFVAGYVVLVGRRTAILRERVRASEEMATVHTQLLRAEKLATVGALAAGIAHEIGTPLGVVRGRAEYVLGKLAVDHPQADSLRIIADQVDRIARNIQALLDFSRIKPGETMPVALRNTAQKCAELLRHDSDRRGVRVTIEIPDGTTVDANADQLEQVLVNLLINAMVACEGGGQIVVRATGRTADDVLDCEYVAIEVEDDGVGISAEGVEHAFDPFFTTKKPGEGTGLGLTIVAQIVRDHGGVVTLRPGNPRGTVVDLAWPVSRKSHGC